MEIDTQKRKILESVALKPYFSEDNFVLYNEDSLEFLERLPENSIDMIFADPPYNLSNGGFTVHAGRRVSVNKGDWDKSRGFIADFNFHNTWILIQSVARTLDRTSLRNAFPLAAFRAGNGLTVTGGGAYTPS